MSRTVPQAEAARSVVVRLRGHRANMSDDYFQVILLIERLHRQFLDVVKLELDALRVHDVNNVQALMLFNMGDAEISVGELTMRGYYLVHRLRRKVQAAW